MPGSFPIQALLFDLDGTLVDRQSGAKKWLASQYAKFPAPRGDFADFYAHSTAHYQMLGYPDSVQNDVRYESAEAERDWRDWRLLFQIGEDEAANTIWGDTGLLYWTIRQADLKARRFDKCRFIFQCC